MFALFPILHGTVALTAAAFLVLVCFDGCVGTMPAFAADHFGALNIGTIDGAMLTAWGFGTVFGSSLLTDIRQRTGSYGAALHILAAIALAAVILPLLIWPAKLRPNET